MKPSIKEKTGLIWMLLMAIFICTIVVISIYEGRNLEAKRKNKLHYYFLSQSISSTENIISIFGKNGCPTAAKTIRIEMFYSHFEYWLEDMFVVGRFKNDCIFSVKRKDGRPWPRGAGIIFDYEQT